MVFGLFKDYKKIAAEGIDNEFKTFEKIHKKKKGHITPDDFKKEFSKKLFFRKVKCDMEIPGRFGYEFAFSLNDKFVPFYFYGWFINKKIDSFEFSCIDEKFYNIEGGYYGLQYGKYDVKTRNVAVINEGGFGKYGGSIALKKILIKDYGFKDEKKGLVDKGRHL